MNPLLILNCNGNNVIFIYVDESMPNATKTVIVKDGANCTNTVQNTIGDIDWIKDKIPILHITFIIYHGDESNIEQNPIVVASGETKTKNTIDF